MKVSEEHTLLCKAIELLSNSISTQRLHQFRGEALENEQIDVWTFIREQLFRHSFSALSHFAEEFRCFLIIKETILQSKVALVEQRFHQAEHRVHGSMIQFLLLAEVGFTRIHR